MSWDLPPGYGDDFVVFETCRRATDGYASGDRELLHLLWATWGMDSEELLSVAQDQRSRRVARRPGMSNSKRTAVLLAVYGAAADRILADRVPARIGNHEVPE